MKARLVTVFLALALALILASSCSPDKRKTPLVVSFDVEDHITPESEGIDDIPKWLAEIMSDEGVPGTFFVIGEKARALERRGRRDVIAAMSRHDIGSHTNFGSIHPTVTEELERADWEGGLRLMFSRESAGFRDLERIFGTPVASLARHGGSYGPQLVGALSEMKASYVGSPIDLPGRNVVWFCNALNFSGQVDGFDDTYYRDDLFEPRLEKLKDELTDLAATSEALQFFAGHPTKIRAEQFWDFNYYSGANPRAEGWKAPVLRPLESMETARKNFRRLLRYLKGREDIELTTFRALMDRYSRQKGVLTRRELGEFAAKALRMEALVASENFSPAEAFAGIVTAILEYRKSGSLPRKMKTVRPLGPAELPPAQPEIGRVTLEDVYALAASADEYIRRADALPAFLNVEESRVGAGSLFALFSTVYLDLDSGRAADIYDVPSFDPYPKTNEAEILKRVRSFAGWPVHRRDLDMTNIVELTKAQLWTLKPARNRSSISRVP